MQFTWYLAAPFFNRQEVSTVERIENAITDAGHGLTSPRAMNPSVQEVKVPPNKVFKDNVDGLFRASGLIAWVDRKQVNGNSVWLLDENKVPIKGPLEQPDLGTVWEMGAAYALGRPIAIFTEKPRGSGTLNLMLTEGANWIIYGHAELRRFMIEFKTDQLMFSFNKNWQGQVE